MKNIPKKLIIHHLGGSDDAPLADTSHHTFDMVNQDHKEKWDFKSSLGHYIGYHYFISKEGVVTQGRADTDEGAHTRGQNTSSLGIALAGNFDVTKPTQSQERALRDLLIAKMTEYSLIDKDIVPHRTYANKTCYGKLLSDTWARDLVKDTAPKPPVLSGKLTYASVITGALISLVQIAGMTDIFPTAEIEKLVLSLGTVCTLVLGMYGRYRTTK